MPTPLAPEVKLRIYLAEEVPSGGSDSDTLFSDAEIEDILYFTPNNPQNNLYLCAAEGWRRKAARYADLVTTQTGGSQRLMSDLHQKALDEEERYIELAYGRRVPRSAKIKRPGTTIY